MPSSIDDLVAKLPEYKRKHVKELYANVLFMYSKLKETRKGIKRQQVVIPYDNGGGQTGIRKNPAFDEYRQLLSAYVKALNELCALLDVQEDAKPATLAKFDVLAGAGKLKRDA